MATNGANINSPANLQAYAVPVQAAPIETPRTIAPATTAPTTKPTQRGLTKDEFQKADVKQDAVRGQQTARVQRRSPEQAQQLAEKIANNSIATGNAALIAQPNTQKPEDKKSNAKETERKIARLVRQGKADEASELIGREVKNAFAQRDIDSANKWMQMSQKVRTGKLSLPTPDLVADGQMSSNYARGLSNNSEITDLLNNISATPGAGSVADAKLASFLRNKSGAERMAPPEATYSPRLASATERATALASALSLTGTAPWDSPKLIAA